jgi:hypothetical protein
MSNITIQIPESSFNYVLASLYQASVEDQSNGYKALSDRLYSIAKEIEELNGDTEEALTEVGSDCDCDGRDADEIAVYLHDDELEAINAAMQSVTFGSLDDAISVLSHHSAMREIEATLSRITES